MQEKIEGIPDGYKIKRFGRVNTGEVYMNSCLLYTSDAADEQRGVDLGGRRIIKKKKFF